MLKQALIAIVLLVTITNGSPFPGLMGKIMDVPKELVKTTTNLGKDVVKVSTTTADVAAAGGAALTQQAIGGVKNITGKVVDVTDEIPVLSCIVSPVASKLINPMLDTASKAVGSGYMGVSKVLGGVNAAADRTLSLVGATNSLAFDGLKKLLTKYPKPL